MKSRVLLVIPTLGTRLDTFKATLDSISGQDESADIVVVVPAAAAEARALAESYGATVVDDPGSHSGAINLGIGHAQPHHLYANWIGDDDLLEPGAVRTAASALAENPDAVVAFGYCWYIDDEGRRIFLSRVGRLAPWLMRWGPDMVPQPGMLFRIDAFREVEGIDESLHMAMDLDLLLRLRRQGRFINTKRTLASFRWHADSKTVSDRSNSLDESEAVKRRYYSPTARRVAFVWEKPVRAATRIAAIRVTKRARRINQTT